MADYLKLKKEKEERLKMKLKMQLKRKLKRKLNKKKKIVAGNGYKGFNVKYMQLKISRLIKEMKKVKCAMRKNTYLLY